MIFTNISSEILLFSVIMISTSIASGSYIKEDSLTNMEYEPEIKESLSSGQIKAMYNLLFSYLEDAEKNNIAEELEKKSIYLPRIGNVLRTGFYLLIKILMFYLKGSEKRASIFLPRIGTQRRSFHMPRVGRSLGGAEYYFPEKYQKKSFHMPRVGK